MRRIIIVLVVVTILAGAFLVCRNHWSGNTRPNLIVILVDTLRADHLGCYGYDRDTSPFLDSFSRRGMLFETCSSAASRTGPSVASLFTSLYPSFHGAVNPIAASERRERKAVLRDENLTIAEILRMNGFRTYAVFSNANSSPKYGYAQGFDDFVFHHNVPAESVRVEACEFLTRRKRNEPFFLYIHFMDPHSPYRPPPGFRDRFDKDYSGRITGSTNDCFGRIMTGGLSVSERDIDHMVAEYDSEICYFDQEFEKLVATIESLGLVENSIIIVTSDHGEEFLEHGKLLHGYTLYRQALHVPLIIVGPGTPPGRTRAPVTLLDLLPTLLNLLEISDPNRFQGRDLTALFNGGHVGAAPLFAEASLSALFTVRLKSLMKDDWKYIRSLSEEAEELYFLPEDPDETVNVVSAHPTVVLELREQMSVFLRRAAEAPQATSVPMDAETMGQLRSLGYLQ